jgi:hypothetical protein
MGFSTSSELISQHYTRPGGRGVCPWAVALVDRATRQVETDRSRSRTVIGAGSSWEARIP